MAGHSHWAGIKHKKALIDNKRGKVWSRISKAIIIAAKLGGGDVETNGRLRLAVSDAKAANMPNDNIQRAIKKGTGELDGGDVEEVLYEGYGPGGVAIMCDIMTDNRNRTAPELRKLFEKHGGKLGATNCVAYMFERRGLFVFSAANIDEGQLMEVGLEAGAEDIREDGDRFEVVCHPDTFSQIAEAFDNVELVADTKQITRLPNNTVDLDADTARKVLSLMEALDDHDDVQNVSANFNIPEDAMAELAAEES